MAGVSGFFSTASAWLPLAIFVARVTDVSLGTVRLICITRGQRTAAMWLGFLETCIWVFAISSVFAHLDRLENILAYAGGFAAGNGMGMWLEARLGMGAQTLSFISRGAEHAVAQGLQQTGFCVTALSGTGRDGPVSVCLAVLPRKHVPAAIRASREIDPDVVVTVEDVRESTAAGLRRLGAGKVPLLSLPAKNLLFQRN
jgi:uncharacterized protein YebE (UPF0316 family)